MTAPAPHARATQELRLVRRGRDARVQPRHPDAPARRRPRGLPGQADHRDRQHLVRAEPVPHAPAGTGRAGQAGHLGGGRLPGRVRRGVAVRDVPEADPDAVPQPAGHGHRGAAPVLPGRRRGADGRLRQDHPGAADGRGQRGHPGHLPAGRADAARQLPRRHPGQRHRPVEVLGRQAGRADRRLRNGRPGRRHRPLAWALHDDGHRVHHDLGRRGARHDAARRRVHPGGRLGALPDGHRDRPPDRGHGLGEPDPGPDPDRGGVRGRGGHACWPWAARPTRSST